MVVVVVVVVVVVDVVVVVVVVVDLQQIIGSNEHEVDEQPHSTGLAGTLHAGKRRSQDVYVCGKSALTLWLWLRSSLWLAW